MVSSLVHNFVRGHLSPGHFKTLKNVMVKCRIFFFQKWNKGTRLDATFVLFLFLFLLYAILSDMLIKYLDKWALGSVKCLGSAVVQYPVPNFDPFYI